MAWAAAVVESRLRCDKLLQEELRLFFRTASPSFRSFSFSASGEVAEFSAQSFALFCDFAELVGRHTERFLRALGLSWDDFAVVMEDALEREDDSALALKDFLRCTADFAVFAALMADKYREIYSTNTAAAAAAAAGSSNAISAVAVSPSAPIGVEKREREEEKSSAPQTTQRNVRVLWDIENVSVPRGITGLEAVQRLRGFLEREGLCGSGVDCRLSAFFHPQRHSLSQRLVEDLDRAGVELVWVSTKREDADRKIVFRLSQEMAVLSPSQAVFVIITSDNDFRHSLQLLRNHGYRLLVIHEHQSEALAMQADQSFDWRRDVLGESESVAPPSSAAAGAVSGKDKQRDDKKAQASEEKEGSEEKAKRTRAKKLEAIAQAGNGDSERRKDDGSEANNESRRQREIGWFAAKCVRWKGAFGFLSISKEEVIKAFNALPPSTSPQDGERDALLDHELQALFVDLTKDREGERVTDDLRCYAHYKTLRLSSKKTTLNKDDAVYALVALCAKGLRATKVVSPEDHELTARK